MIDLNKLKKEWKTFAWGIVSVAVESWDTILSAQLGYVDPMVSQDHQWIIHVAIPLGFFILRKWKDDVRPGSD